MGVAFQECFDDDPLLPPELLPRPGPVARRASSSCARAAWRCRSARRTTGPACSEPSTTSSNRSPRTEPASALRSRSTSTSCPGPWGADDEHQLLKDALDQVELADRIGFDHVWEVEHHFLEEYSHSSAPEVFLAAASQRTRRIRLGHGIVQLPQGFNHSARVAERIATLDLVSDGRVDFGTGESSSEAELGGFGVDRDTKRENWEEALDAVTRMFVEEPFAGYDGRFLQMPPAQRRAEAAAEAAPAGVGRLLAQGDDPPRGREGHRRAVVLVHQPRRGQGLGVATTTRRSQSEQCVPAGFAVNPNLAIVLPFMCHEDEATAVERGIDGGHFFGFSLLHYYAFGDHHPGRTDIWAEFQEKRSLFGFDRTIAAGPVEHLGATIEQNGIGSLRGAVGTPDQVPPPPPRSTRRSASTR